MKLIFENWQKFIDEEVKDKPYRTDADAKKDVLGSMYEGEDENSEVEKAVIDVLKDEGGAAGLEPIEKAVQDLDLPDNFDLKDFLAGLGEVGEHVDGDYILDDGQQIRVNKQDLQEGIEIFLEAQEELLDEKRKRKKKKKKKKKKKRDACYHKVKARYKVWPSAYASGALVKCRNVGAGNWGNKSK